MILSLNEIETTVLKAARGSGMSWGLAEEAANAARWLASRGIAFEGTLLAVLGARADDAATCPIIAGALISDRGGLSPQDRLESVRGPVLLLPFLARLANASLNIELRFDGHCVWVTPGGPFASPQGLAILAAPVNAAGLHAIATTAAPAAGVMHWPLARDGCRLDADVWRKLQAYEARTYVPASAQSRISGAGAGDSDND